MADTKRTCSIDGCPHPVKGFGYCQNHYRKFKKYGDPLAPNPRAKGTCNIEGCNDPHKGLGLCNKHIIRLRKFGDPLATPWEISLEDRFWNKVNKAGPIPLQAPHLGPCWEWTSSRNGGGYGTFRIRDRPEFAHRVAWELTEDAIPDGLEIDHLCVNPPCVNPDHLEPVTARVNTLRSSGPSAINAQKTHCIRGHELTGENVYWRNDRLGRECRPCSRIRRKQRIA